ncbi:hypothetical protein GGS23DRAFT_615716 [Durotheca rogersii]|uniref:uncharacterized protein n=1 Tax=Durotheca rogersii TaxID=419775 RepID=UPI00221F598C|nr:uncharacterized protein GGS23DRAFT_615716 [Durotheca rogersii]KAI5867030.1 hypothetical protein GGS23DRAFT_615716 [Durotheca rogersii]
MAPPNPHRGQPARDQNDIIRTPSTVVPPSSIAPMSTTGSPGFQPLFPDYSDWTGDLGPEAFTFSIPTSFGHQQQHPLNVAAVPLNFQDPALLGGADHNPFREPFNIPGLMHPGSIAYAANLFSHSPKLSSPSAAGVNTGNKKKGTDQSDAGNPDHDDADDDGEDCDQKRQARSFSVGGSSKCSPAAAPPRSEFGPPFKPRPIMADMTEAERAAVVEYNNGVAREKRERNRHLNRLSARRSRRAKQDRLDAAEADVGALRAHGSQLRAVGRQLVAENAQLRRAYVDLRARNAALGARVADAESHHQHQHQHQHQHLPQRPLPQRQRFAGPAPFPFPAQAQGGGPPFAALPVGHPAAAATSPQGAAQPQQVLHQHQLKSDGAEDQHHEDPGSENWQIFLQMSPDAGAKE